MTSIIKRCHIFFYFWIHFDMRINALILFFPFAVFLAETASFVPAMKDACAIVVPEKSSCCMKVKKQESSCSKSQKPNACDPKKDTGKKTSGNRCTDNPDCTTCPVCYMFIVQPRYEWRAQLFLLKKNYSELSADYISSYTSNVWKPPNGFLYSS